MFEHNRFEAEDRNDSFLLFTFSEKPQKLAFLFCRDDGKVTSWLHSNVKSSSSATKFIFCNDVLLMSR